MQKVAGGKVWKCVEAGELGVLMRCAERRLEGSRVTLPPRDDPYGGARYCSDT